MGNEPSIDVAARNQVKAQALQDEQRRREREQQRQIDLLERQIEDEKQLNERTLRELKEEANRLEAQERELRHEADRKQESQAARRDRISKENHERAQQREQTMQARLDNERKLNADELREAMNRNAQEMKNLEMNQKEKEQRGRDEIERRQAQNAEMNERKRQEIDRYKALEMAQVTENQNQLLDLANRKGEIVLQGKQNLLQHQKRMGILQTNGVAMIAGTVTANQSEISERNYVQAIKDVQQSITKAIKPMAVLSTIKPATDIKKAEKYEQTKTNVKRAIQELEAIGNNVINDLERLIGNAENKIDGRVKERQDIAKIAIEKLSDLTGLFISFKDYLSELNNTDMHKTILKELERIKASYKELSTMIMGIPPAYVGNHVQNACRTNIAMITGSSGSAAISQIRIQQITNGQNEPSTSTAVVQEPLD